MIRSLVSHVIIVALMANLIIFAFSQLFCSMVIIVSQLFYLRPREKYSMHIGQLFALVLVNEPCTLSEDIVLAILADFEKFLKQ